MSLLLMSLVIVFFITACNQLRLTNTDIKKAIFFCNGADNIEQIIYTKETQIKIVFCIDTSYEKIPDIKLPLQ